VAVRDFVIEDRTSFDATVGEPRQVARLYFYLALDPLMDLAYFVACDFFGRPVQYSDLGGDPGDPAGESLAEKLAKLHARWGTDERFPSREKRDAIYLPVFGTPAGSFPNGAGDFPRLSAELLKEVQAFVERVATTGEDELRGRIKRKQQALGGWLSLLNGDSLRWSSEHALTGLAEDFTYTVFRDAGVAAIFGNSVPPGADFPYATDSAGDKLVEQVSSQLGRYGARIITREEFISLQAVAARGAEALATIVDFPPNPTDEDLQLLIAKCDAWGQEVAELKAAVQREGLPVMTGAPSAQSATPLPLPPPEATPLPYSSSVA
jgi:hypothetical protein